MEKVSESTNILHFLNALSANMIPVLITVFAVAVFLRLLVYWNIRRELWFVRELEKRIFRDLSSVPANAELSFFRFIKNILQKTYHEIFELRRVYGRRHHDQVMSVNDRVFLVQEGVARLIMDFLRHARYLKHTNEQPNFLDISKSVFENNKIFGNIFGIISVNWVNNFLNLLPNLFVICGIFGTFLGIMDGLPGLSNLDVTDAAKSQTVMDAFLLKMAFAMNKSALGIVLSVCMTLINSTFGPESIYFNVITRFTAAVGLVWNRSNNNEITAEDVHFVDARDKLEIEADDALRYAERFKIDHQILSNAVYFPDYFKGKASKQGNQDNKPQQQTKAS